MPVFPFFSWRKKAHWRLQLVQLCPRVYGNTVRAKSFQPWSFWKFARSAEFRVFPPKNQQPFLRDEIIFPSVRNSKILLKSREKQFPFPPSQIPSVLPNRDRALLRILPYLNPGLYVLYARWAATTPTSGSTLPRVYLYPSIYSTTITLPSQLPDCYSSVAGKEIIYLCWQHLDRNLYPSASDYGFPLSTNVNLLVYLHSCGN